MPYSPHQLAYFAHQLTRRAASDSMDRMAGALLTESLAAPLIAATKRQFEQKLSQKDEVT